MASRKRTGGFRPGRPPGQKPRLLTPDLEAYIERVHRREAAAATERRLRADVLRAGWASPGGRELKRFVATRPAEATRRAYTQHLDDFLLWAGRHGSLDPLDLGPEDLARYERHVEETVSAATGRRLSVKTRQDRVRTVRTAYTYLEREGLLERNPARHLRVRGRAEPKSLFLDGEAAATLLSAAEGTGLVELRDRSLLLVLLHTGLRAAEAASLTWDAVSERPHPSVTVEGKGNVVRTVPLSGEALKVLKAWAARVGARFGSSGFVWTRLRHSLEGNEGRASGEGLWVLTGDRLSPESIYQIVRRRAAAGVEATPHALRRTYATALRDMGVSLDTIRRYLGHASIQTTIRYLSPRDEEAAAAVRSLSLGLGVSKDRRR